MAKSVKTVQSLLRKPGTHRVSKNLYAIVRDAADGGTRAAWAFRYFVNGKPHWHGLGPTDVVTLAEAREKVIAARKLVLDGGDPIAAKRERRIAAKVEAAKTVTFQDAAEKYVAANESSWKNEKHRQQWVNTLKSYAFPTLGPLPVSAIDTPLILKVLDPIWDTKRETAMRLRGRIERVLAWATVRGYRSGDNPARWQGHLREALNRNGKTVEHHAALPYGELPAFMAELRCRDSVSARALEFTILTAARTGETVGATDSEIDLGQKLWTVPGDRMKKGKTHIVPLPDRAIEILNDLPREDDNPFVFIGAKKGVGLSNAAMMELLKGIRPGLTVHGFRSTFSDWAGDCTNFDRQTREFALAHGLTDKTEASYRHMTAVEKRRKLMDAWAKYCASRPATGDNVTPLRKGRES
jgi:integrase